MNLHFPYSPLHRSQTPSPTTPFPLFTLYLFTTHTSSSSLSLFSVYIKKKNSVIGFKAWLQVILTLLRLMGLKWKTLISMVKEQQWSSCRSIPGLCDLKYSFRVDVLLFAENSDEQSGLFLDYISPPFQRLNLSSHSNYLWYFVAFLESTGGGYEVPLQFWS